MKKNIIYICIFVIIVIFFSYLIYYLSCGHTIINELLFRKNYYSREIITHNLEYENNNIENNIISKNTISIKLSNLEYSKSNGNILKLNFDLFKNDNKTLNNIGFVLRIHDDKNTFYNKCVGGFVFDDNNNYMRYTKYYSKDIYNKELYDNSNTVVLDNSDIISIYNSEDNSSKKLDITFDLEDSYDISSSLYIEFLDIQYQNEGDSNYYKLIEPLGEFKYIINF